MSEPAEQAERPEQPGPALALTAPAEPDVVEQVQERLADLWESEGVDPGTAMRFEMGLVEILGNIVEHAYAPDAPGRMLTVEVEVRDGVVRGTLGDNGQPIAIDLSSVTMPDEDAESGRGLALALAALDELAYERDGGRNRWHLRCGT
ncbi:ATP-binding protein [Nocardioides sp. TRM66260-LWL]|uniref:ATP-binding protein n=1 Tax=Nocardioides sp. TRM66260-LWL TaxID=2874478 RepID=UPI001CC7ABDD|nr:ATP-binding protein [Nocardioides sp. TRM66260-LWL]MBZ5732916.1 ATP-binding protein [Nocardioides sp. TRM66260-LWL]